MILDNILTLPPILESNIEGKEVRKMQLAILAGT